MDQKLLTDFRSELLDSRFGAKAISTIAESKRFPLHEMRWRNLRILRNR